MAADYQLTFHDYLSIVRRWGVVIILVIGSVLAVSVVVALLAPRVYESYATILVEGPRIQADAGGAGNANPAEDRVQVLRQRLMTRENLLRIVRKHELFPEEAMSSPGKEFEVAEAMRGSTGVQVMTLGGGDWQRPASVSFNLSFQHSDPEKALAVVQELVTLFLQSNTQSRVEQAARTTEFFNAEAERLKEQLEQLERQIAAYKQRQGGVMPDATSNASIQTLEADLRGAERDHRAALDELRTLEVELAGARAGVMAPGAGTSVGPTSTEQELERARAELARIRGIYTESHPDIRAQIRRIETLEKAVIAEANAVSPSRTAAAAQAQLAVSLLEAQISSTRSRAELSADQQRSLRANIARLRSQVLRAPQVERDLAALQRDYDSAQAKYEDLRAKQLSAQVVENMEGGQQAERFTLLEPPLLPEYPIKPSRKKMVALGFFLSLAAAAGVVVVLENLFARVRGVNAVSAITGQRPLVVIPYISTMAELRASHALRKRSAWLIASAGLLCLVLIHLFIMPLNTLLIAMFARLG
ncbi:MAG: lipopolysaccharide biosynthesis protein [Betaproteobacteria bacterium HGW-Betaproteobacteria-16]|nr:MAG: lipopolysaccharide biosynthesis protein [Betaproteobacteria bacterium HGW-Betaproteobacteria-16]